MAYGVGDTIQDGFSTGIAGETFTINKSRDPGGTSFTPTFTDLGDGDYIINKTVNAAGAWFVRWTGNASGLEFNVTWPVVSAQQADPVQYLGGAGIIVTSPLSPSGDLISVVQGDSYLDADGEALVWSSSGWADLTGATVTLTIVSGSTTLTITPTVSDAGAATQTITADLTAAQTAQLRPGRAGGRYNISAVLSSGGIKTLAEGSVRVLGDFP